MALLRSPSHCHFGADSSMVTLERDLLGPTVGLVLDICNRVEETQREKRPLQIADCSFDLALGLGPAGQQNNSGGSATPANSAPTGS